MGDSSTSGNSGTWRSGQLVRRPVDRDLRLPPGRPRGAEFAVRFVGLAHQGVDLPRLLYRRAFVEAGPDVAIVQTVSGQLPWWHNAILLRKLEEPQVRERHARKAIEYGWSGPILTSPRRWGVAEWTAKPLDELPRELRDALPSVEQIEERLGSERESTAAPEVSGTASPDSTPRAL